MVRLRSGVKSTTNIDSGYSRPALSQSISKNPAVAPSALNRIKENLMNTKVSASKIGLLIVIAIAAGSASLAAQDKPAFWHITTLYAFTGNADGAVPYGGVVLDPAGNVYGTTAYGGSGGELRDAGCGVVFKVDPRGHESLLHTFTGYPATAPILTKA